MMAGGGGGEEPRRGGGLFQTYGAFRSRPSASSLSEINVTPFVDVVLVLLVIFMITAPLLVRSIDVNLPAAKLRQDNASERITITLDALGRTYVDDKAVNVALLLERIKEAVEMRGVRVAYLKADESLRYGKVIEIVDIARRAGVDNIGMVYVYPEEKTER